MLPRSIATKEAFENAMALDVAMGSFDQHCAAHPGDYREAGC